jgi:hypothetical protein
MAILNMKPGAVEITLDAEFYANIAPNVLESAPGGLFPLVARAYMIDEYRLMAGWPVSIPGIDVRGQSIISLNGDRVSNRLDPDVLRTGADLRWCSSSGYDDTLGTWEPIQWTQAPNTITAVPANAPVETEYIYRVQDEVFHRMALAFDSDDEQYMSLDLSSQVSGVGMTVIFVFSPNNTQGDQAGLLTSYQSSLAAYSNAYIQGQYVYIQTESQLQRAAPIATAMRTNAPFYLAITLDRPTVHTYSGPGPSSIQAVSVPSGWAEASIQALWRIGSNGTGTDSFIDMALFDMGVYYKRLTFNEVQTEFAILSRSYGGDT